MARGLTDEERQKRNQAIQASRQRKFSDRLIYTVCRRYLNLTVLGYWERKEVIERVAREQSINPTQVISILMTYLPQM